MGPVVLVSRADSIVYLCNTRIAIVRGWKMRNEYIVHHAVQWWLFVWNCNFFEIPICLVNAWVFRSSSLRAVIPWLIEPLSSRGKSRWQWSLKCQVWLRSQIDSTIQIFNFLRYLELTKFGLTELCKSDPNVSKTAHQIAFWSKTI